MAEPTTEPTTKQNRSAVYSTTRLPAGYKFSPENFLPAPRAWKSLVVPPEERIKELKALLGNPMFSKQEINILALIELYETGKMKPLTRTNKTWLCNGKIVDRSYVMDLNNPPPEGSVIWPESGQARPVQAYSTGFMAGSDMHEIFARIRLSPGQCGDPNHFIECRISNDTGSNGQGLFRSDLDALNLDPLTYLGLIFDRRVETAGGVLNRLSIIIEMQIVSSEGDTLTPWFQEEAIVWEDYESLQRLSGSAMREYLYFATAPGNQKLYMAKKKGGLMSLLPAINLRL
ncbi:hypothetical protein N7495_000157 [Penicillium taxi]|uniref:uncharacterized protein n=1 Tax=Penicillium taxi TaxID=168475 RepID=UPI002545B38E|nr:uncharacterized protein N7495_000157 [Penicillium taxi]KAJ5907475.1 hypothetical protein N7495_000157 [Penicillium taxi]